MQASVHHLCCLAAIFHCFNLSSAVFKLFTIAPGSCIDKDSNCRNYQSNICTDPTYAPYVKDNCAAFCKLCPPAVTTAPKCVDVDAKCASYGTTFCTDDAYKKYRDDNCRKHCRLCTSGGRSSGNPPNRPNFPTKAPACVDRITDCHTYGTDVCSIATYHAWVNTNCKKWCNRC